MKKTIFIAQAALIAALYVVLTYLANALGLASGVIQVRFSEALTVIPFFTPAAIPGLFVGCLLANLLTGCAPMDVVFGSLATLIGAVGTYLIGRAARAKRTENPVNQSPQGQTPAAPAPKGLLQWLAPVPPILSNMLIIPWILSLVYMMEDSIPFLMLTVGAGEIISCGILGMLLFFALKPRANLLFK